MNGSVAAILFDFDGVLIDSEYAGNRHLAECLKVMGHPITPEEAIGRDFVIGLPTYMK